jgi:hypothetical protein
MLGVHIYIVPTLKQSVHVVQDERFRYFRELARYDRDSHGTVFAFTNVESGRVVVLQGETIPRAEAFYHSLAQSSHSVKDGLDARLNWQGLLEAKPV